MKYILALDQGTTSSRAIVFDKKGQIKGVVQQEYPQIYPKSGWVEHNPLDILGSQVGVISEVLIRAHTNYSSIEAIGITNQRETTIVWDKNTGEPVYNAIVWQCRRTADYCDYLKAQGYSKKIYDKTGLILDSYFSATKIKWILDNVEGAREKANKGDLLFGTVDTYLMWNLSGGKIHATDYTNASRTMLFNIHELKWDEELLKLFDIPKSMLPNVYPSGHNYGNTDKDVIGFEVPICGVVGDQQGALFGQLCVNKGEAKNTYGTGCFMLMNVGKDNVKSKNGLVTTLAASLDEKPNYVLEGSVFVGGAIIQWLRDELKLIEDSKSSEKYALKVKDTNGVYIIPAFVGLGAPYWDSEARGTIVGLTRGANKDHLIRASLESIAYQVKDSIDAMQKDLGMKMTELKVDGGASQNNFLMQFQSDILNCKVVRPKVVEVTALGAAYLAGLTCGYWNSIEEIKENLKIDKEFDPLINEEERDDLTKGWEKAVKITQYHPK